MTEFQKAYYDLLIFQYQDKPKFKAELLALLEKFEDSKKLGDALLAGFDIDIAIGKQLDIIGKIVGLSRKTEDIIPKEYFGFKDININATGFGGSFYKFGDEIYTDLELNDNDYRFFLKAKIANNFMKNNIHKINEIIDYLFNSNAYVVDNRDTTFTLFVNQEVPLRLVSIAIDINLLPRPQTIRYNNFIRYDEANTLGFRDVNPNAVGFGGSFARILKF